MANPTAFTRQTKLAVRMKTASQVRTIPSVLYDGTATYDGVYLYGGIDELKHPVSFTRQTKTGTGLTAPATKSGTAFT